MTVLVGVRIETVFSLQENPLGLSSGAIKVTPLSSGGGAGAISDVPIQFSDAGNGTYTTKLFTTKAPK